MSPDLPQTTQSRISHAFHTFCAIYGFRGVRGDATANAPAICYGLPVSRTEDAAIPALYRVRPASEPAPAPVNVQLTPSPLYTRLELSDFPSFHARMGSTDVDWLGEIFEWVSCADERAVTGRDDIGRIPFDASVHGRYKLDPSVPYAAIAMHELNRHLCRTFKNDWPERPTPPNAGRPVLIASSHDLDYIPINAAGNAMRLAKNAAIAALHFRDPKLLTEIVASALVGAVSLKSPLNYIDKLATRQRTEGISATYNVICKRVVARDANYELENRNVQRALRFLDSLGMEIGLHGSYTSLESGGQALKLEAERLANCGYKAVGIRQHWLRFSGDDLFRRIAELGLSYDSTVGFAERVGFRSGASFPYLPYDFEHERAYPFVEIPLVVMDVALYEQARRERSSETRLCHRVFDMIEAFGWGGVAILWHNTAFGGGQMPRQLGRLYWELKRTTHTWVSCREVADITLQLFGSELGSRAAC